MRSKLVVWGYLVILSLGTMLSLYMPKTEAAAKESIVIPGEAIRLRILANSDFDKDQAIKRKVRDAVNAQITLWVQDLTSMQEAKKVINAKLPEIQSIAEQVVSEQGSDQAVNVEFGKVQFPTKLYGQYLYPAGEYQAILITLGKGEGANWWCVLYPPLCFLDFSNGVAVSDGFEEEKTVKAKTAVKEETPEPVEEPVNKEEIAVTETTEKAPSTEEPVQTKKQPVSTSEKTTQEHVEKEKAVSKTKGPDKRLVQTDEPSVEPAAKTTVKTTTKTAKTHAPVYTAEDEQPIKVKFFAVEMWKKLFH